MSPEDLARQTAAATSQAAAQADYIIRGANVRARSPCAAGCFAEEKGVVRFGRAGCVEQMIKEEGNNLFRAGKHAEAAAKYSPPPLPPPSSSRSTAQARSACLAQPAVSDTCPCRGVLVWQTRAAPVAK
eukprot:1197122-Rhodomonas_salina.1